MPDPPIVKNPDNPDTPAPPAGPLEPKTATIAAGQPVTTTDPTLAVAAPATPGTYTYSLVVEDDLNVTSKPATIEVTVQAVIQ